MLPTMVMVIYFICFFTTVIECMFHILTHYATGTLLVVTQYATLLIQLLTKVRATWKSKSYRSKRY